MPAALFDLDGTLHDRAEGLRRFVSVQARELCAGAIAQEAFCAAFLQLDDNGRVWKDRVYEELRSQFGSSSWPATQSLVQAYVREYPSMAVETPGASQLLKRLRRQGIRLAIITNGRTVLQRAVVAALGFDRLVDTIVVSEEAGFRKPQPEIFGLALEALDCGPADAVTVGDDPIADIDGARGAGIAAIAFRCTAVAGVPRVTDLECAGVEILSRFGFGAHARCEASGPPP